MALDKIWVVVDRSGDKVAPVSLELLTKAREIGGTVEGITWGDAGALAGDVGAFGASVLHTVGDLGGGLPGPAVAAAMAAQIAGGNAPDAILVAQTYDGRDIAGRLSARIDRPVLTNIVGLEAADGGLVTRARHLRRHRDPQRPVHRRVARASSWSAPSPSPPSRPGPVRPPSTAGRCPSWARKARPRCSLPHAEESEGPKLDEAAIVVSGGRGLGEAGGYKMIEELAKLLGGAAGASRAIVDAGLGARTPTRSARPARRSSRPIYIAAGISGATQHMVGMKSAKNIIAINKDQEAPIFSIADLGIVGDVNKVLPKLIEALQQRK